MTKYLKNTKYTLPLWQLEKVPYGATKYIRHYFYVIENEKKYIGSRCAYTYYELRPKDFLAYWKSKPEDSMAYESLMNSKEKGNLKCVELHPYASRYEARRREAEEILKRGALKSSEYWNINNVSMKEEMKEESKNFRVSRVLENLGFEMDHALFDYEKVEAEERAREMLQEIEETFGDYSILERVGL